MLPKNPKASVENLKDFLNSKTFNLHIKWLNKRQYAEIDFEKKTLTINIYFLLTECLVHEYLHHKNPDWREGKIEVATDKFIRKMKVHEIKEIGTFILKAGEWKI